MKIIVFGNYPEWLINFRGSLMQEMVRQGDEVIACAPHADSRIISRLSDIGVSYRNIPVCRDGFYFTKDVATIYQFFRLLKEEKPDMVFLYTIKPIIFGTISARFAKIQKISSMIEGLGYVFTGNGNLRKIRKSVVMSLYKAVLCLNFRIFFLNPDDRMFFIQKRLCTRRKSVLLNGTGVNLQHYFPCPSAGTTSVSFILAARLLKEKGVYEYARAAESIKRHYPDAVFYLAGWIDDMPSAIDEKDLESWIRSGVIHYLGYCSDIRNALAKSSVFVLPSYYREGLPRTIQEAMAMAKPVITTDMPGCRETVQDGMNGFIIPCRDVGQLIDRMERFLENKSLISSMGWNGRKLAEQKYDEKKINQKIIATLKSV